MASTKHWADQNALALFWAHVQTYLNNKVDKVEGKGLSSNDYTTTEKNKLAGIEQQANKTTIVDNLTSTASGSALSAAQGKALNDRINEVEQEIEQAGGGDMLRSTYDQDMDGVVDNAKALEGHGASYFAKTTDLDGKLDTDGDGSSVTATFTAAGSRGNITSGDTLGVIFGKLAKWFADFKTVAFTGNYNDLTNKPTIPTVTNDLTDALKSNYDAAYAYSQETHAPVNAQANVIETINVNGSAATVTNKAVNLTIPTTVASLADAANYALKSDLTNVYKYKGSVAAVSNLPSSGNTAGDVYDVQEDGMNYAWNGSAWDALGTASVEVEALTAAEIDAIFAS